MARTISIGAQGFEDLRKGGYFYVDKTGFVRDWWEGADVATLVGGGHSGWIREQQTYASRVHSATRLK